MDGQCVKVSRSNRVGGEIQERKKFRGYWNVGERRKKGNKSKVVVKSNVSNKSHGIIKRRLQIC